MRRSHLTAAMVAIALGALGIIRDHGVAAQQRAEMHDMQLVGFSEARTSRSSTNKEIAGSPTSATMEAVSSIP